MCVCVCVRACVYACVREGSFEDLIRDPYLISSSEGLGAAGMLPSQGTVSYVASSRYSNIGGRNMYIVYYISVDLHLTVV